MNTWTWIKCSDKLPAHHDGNDWGCVLALDAYGNVQTMNWRRVGQFDKRWRWWAKMPALPDGHLGHPDAPMEIPPVWSSLARKRPQAKKQ